MQQTQNDRASRSLLGHEVSKYMLRKLQLLLVLVLVAGTTETGVRASTDCERWIASYKAELAHTKALKRLAAAKARVKRLAQHKLATYVKKPTHPGPVRPTFR